MNFKVLEGDGKQLLVGISLMNSSLLTTVCLVEGAAEQLLVIALRKDELIFAFNSVTGKLGWSAIEEVHDPDAPFQSLSVTADDNGHLFVLDITNKCF